MGYHSPPLLLRYTAHRRLLSLLLSNPQPVPKKILFALFVLSAAGALAVFFFFRNDSAVMMDGDKQLPATPTRTESMPASGRDSYLDTPSPIDCRNECVDFQGDAERHDYCRTVCGFSLEEGVLRAPISGNPTLSEDYNLRDAAIREHSLQKCSLIQDANLRKSCEVRVTEDLLE